MHLHTRKKESDKINSQIEDFFQWYYQDFLGNVYTKKNQIHYEKSISDIKKAINKFVAWYEIRYPNDMLNRYCFLDTSNLSHEKTNSAKEDIPTLENILSAKTFIRSLSSKEKELLSVKYPKFICFQNKEDILESSTFHLSRKGTVLEGKLFVTQNCFLNFTGKHITQVLQELKEDTRLKFLFSEEISYIEKIITSYQLKKQLKEKFLQTVMFQILNQDRLYNTSAKRAYLFAKEFHLNMDIPMSYGLDLCDNYLRYFINDYLKNGGNPYLAFENSGENSTIKDALTYLPNEIYDNIVYTKEEQELQQRLINSLNFYIDSKKKRKILQK